MSDLFLTLDFQFSGGFALLARLENVFTVFMTLLFIVCLFC